MTVQSLKKHDGYNQSHNDSYIGNNESSVLIQLFSIAKKMKKAGLADVFIVNAIHTAMEFDGVADLILMWAEENDKKEKEEIIADIQDMIDACTQRHVQQETYIKFNDLEEISKNIRAFKDSLYQEVMKRGGMNKLSELTGIPQSSLSRFFNSNAMPRRSTLLAIAEALDMVGLEINERWVG